MLKKDEAERMVQQLRTLSLTYAACHYEYIESLKGTDKDAITDCRMKMVKAYKDLDRVSRTIKERVASTAKEVIPFPNVERSWGKLVHTLAKIQDDIDEDDFD